MDTQQHVSRKQNVGAAGLIWRSTADLKVGHYSRSVRLKPDTTYCISREFLVSRLFGLVLPAEDLPNPFADFRENPPDNLCRVRAPVHVALIVRNHVRVLEVLDIRRASLAGNAVTHSAQAYAFHRRRDAKVPRFADARRLRHEV